MTGEEGTNCKCVGTINGCGRVRASGLHSWGRCISSLTARGCAPMTTGIQGLSRNSSKMARVATSTKGRSHGDPWAEARLKVKNLAGMGAV